MDKDISARLDWLVRTAPDLVWEVFSLAQQKLHPAPPPEQFLKVSQVCERTGKCHRTVRRWIRDGFLKATHWGRSREWRIRSTDLEAFLKGEQ